MYRLLDIVSSMIDYKLRNEVWQTVQFLIDNPKSKEFSEKLQRIENLAIEYKDSYIAYLIASRIPGSNKSRLQQIIASSLESYYIIDFARHPEADIKLLEDAIVNTYRKRKNPIVLANFAINPRANKERLINLILESKVPAAYYIAIKYIKGCDVELFKEVLINSKRPRYVFELAKHAKTQEEIDLLQDIIINAKSNMYVRMFAKFIVGADIKKLETRIISTNSPLEMERFMKDVPQALRVKKLSSLF